MATTTKTPVMLSGPGKAGKVIGKVIKRSEDFELLPVAFTGTTKEPIEIDGQKIRTIPLSERSSFNPKSEFPSNALVVDFTLPNAILENVKYYAANGMNFMMGTTGVDKVRAEVENIITHSGISSVIVANAGAQIVGLQSVVAKSAKENEGGMKGNTIRVEESHQAIDPERPSFKGKVDPSGTAILFSESFKQLGIEGCPFSSEAILKNPEKYRDTTFFMIRDRKYQLEVLGVPAEHLDGHGWHTYIITENKMSPAFYQLYKNVRDFMKSSPVFNSYSKFERENPKDHKQGCVIERKSPDGNVVLRTELRYDPASYGKTPVMQLLITHNVNGRGIYADGTLTALRFLRNTKEKGRIFSMIDVLGLA
jgi:4-hydroxy-tetrahydrodipicolinate reductase